MQQVIAYLNEIHPLSEGCCKYLEYTLKQKILKRGQYLLMAGKISREICFIETGMIRLFTMDGERKLCSWFVKEGDVVVSVRSFFRQEPGLEHIQALESTSLYYILYEELEWAYGAFPEFNVVGRKLLEKYYVQEAEKNYILRLQPLKKRYAHIQQFHPWMIQRISAKNIASYLGGEEHWLSRIKGGKGQTR